MKKILLLLSIITASLSATAQNCSNTSVGYPPINDLGAGKWRGATGGLYPGGANTRPAMHNAAGLNIAQRIRPLAANGNTDTANGKIVWLSIGMSNTTQESQTFIPEADTLSNKNPKLVLIDGAQGGQDINKIMPDTAAFWNVIRMRLQQAGLTSAQVQAVWFKQAEANPTDTNFNTYVPALKAKLRTVMQIIKQKFPNTRLCYLSSRIYGGYATGTLNPEPYAYYTGWAVKALIQDQISGTDTGLNFTGANARAPWLAWGPYPWADGTTPRNDGLTWICPTDYQADGTHPSAIGRQKVADMLLKFFTTDSTTVPWFLKQSSVLPTSVIASPLAASSLALYPQPAGNQLTIVLPQNASSEMMLVVTDLAGRKLLELPASSKPSININVAGLPAGMYVLRAGDFSARFVKD
jgi:hypothetical protein